MPKLPPGRGKRVPVAYRLSREAVTALETMAASRGVWMSTLLDAIIVAEMEREVERHETNTANGHEQHVNRFDAHASEGNLNHGRR